MLIPSATTFVADRAEAIRRWGFALTAVLVAPAMIAASLTVASLTWFADPHNATPIAAAQLEGDFGIRLDRVAVTAAGGVVDVRFTVTDPEKAERLLVSHGGLPTIVVEDSGAVLRIPHVMRANDPTRLARSSYFLLFPNAGGAVQAGTEVSIVIDGLSLEHIVAQS